MSSINEQLLDERLAALEAARPWSPRVISKLESEIRGGDDAALFRVNPFTFAAEKNLSASEAVDLFLHATAQGLFEMNWVLFCQLCACVAESVRALHDVDAHFRCANCHDDYVATLDDYIAVGFTISPAIRQIGYHRPQELPLADYCFRFKIAREGLFPDESPIAAVKEASTPAIAVLPPGETTALQVTVGDNLIFAWSPDTEAGFFHPVDATRPAAAQTVPVRYGENTCELDPAPLAPGEVTFQVENTTSQRGVLGITLLPAGFELPPLHFAPFLSGKHLLTTQTFRDLFRSEVVRASEGIGINDVTLLFTDLKGSTALYERIGDLNAFSLVQQHFDRLQDVTVRNEGAIIKTIGDAVMATFRDPAAAVRAALAMREEIGEVNRGSADRDLILKIGLHKGAAIAVTLNDRLDYFGQTVNVAARVQHLADAGEIFLSQDVYGAEGVEQILAPFAVEPRSARLRGVGEEIPVYRVPAEPAPREGATVS